MSMVVAIAILATNVTAILATMSAIRIIRNVIVIPSVVTTPSMIFGCIVMVVTSQHPIVGNIPS